MTVEIGEIALGSVMECGTPFLDLFKVLSHVSLDEYCSGKPFLTRIGANFSSYAFSQYNPALRVRSRLEDTVRYPVENSIPRELISRNVTPVHPGMLLSCQPSSWSSSSRSLRDPPVSFLH